MDLGAYAQIDELDTLLAKNHIEIPRLRGLRLMKHETPITDAELKEIMESQALDAVDDLCRNGFRYNANWYTYSWETDMVAERYLEFKKDESGRINHMSPIRIKWENLHGKKRKVAKYKIKKDKQAAKAQWDMWNKYCGKENVLYIHARIGGGNWKYYECDEIIAKAPWCLDYVEDCHDCTYVDIYAQIVDGEV